MKCGSPTTSKGRRTRRSKRRSSQYVFDGALVWHITGARFAGGSAVPFLYGGAGYLRELHEENAFVEEGVEYHAGGGIKWWFGQSGRDRDSRRGRTLDT